MSSQLSRRRFLIQSGLGCAGLVHFGLQAVDSAQASTAIAGPSLHFEQPDLDALYGTAFRNALHNLLVTNTVADSGKKYNRTGLFADSPGTFIRAGGSYATPWTRDASINSWNAASLLAPEVARNTLWAVCEKQATGRLIVQRDNQWWDKAIWAQGAWTHFLVTGDREFLVHSYEAVNETLTETCREHFNERFGLFEGPSVLCDGIAGYPEPPYNKDITSSFILDFEGGDKLMCLSTNCVAYQAYRCAEWMAKELGKPTSEMRAFQKTSSKLQKAIQRHLWMPAKSSFGYFIHGQGPLAGRLDQSQEGMGLAYAILFDVANAKQTRKILQTVHVQPKGIACVWPHFARFSDSRPGRHNVIVWPMASGMWAHAAAKAGAVDRFATEMTNIASMANASDGIFFEIYNSITGLPDGGWQVGKHWDSCVDQTWSATGYLRMVFYGLFGMTFEPEGIRLTPTLPKGWGPVQLDGLRYRKATLGLRLEGEGQQIASVSVDNKVVPSAFISARLSGVQQINIRMRPM